MRSLAVAVGVRLLQLVDVARDRLILLRRGRLEAIQRLRLAAVAVLQGF